jgi:hypothetical protein
VPRWMQVLSFVIGLALLVGAPVAWGLSRPEVSIGEVPSVTASTDPAPPSAADDAPATDDVGVTVPGSETDDTLPPAVRTPSPLPRATDTEPEPERITDPVQIRIDALDVDVPIVPVGLEENREMEIPEDANEIGWYYPGVRPGEKGSAVLAGHVDSKEGPGAFWGLRELALDDIVTITHADGSERSWRVVAREQYPKDELPIDEVFVWGGDSEQLALITCGGDWNRDRASYRDNIVVYTVPA